MYRRLAMLAVVTFALAAACSSNSGNPTVPSPVLERTSRNHRSQSKISHVIVIIQENRSLDDFFAGYPGADASTTGCGKPTPSPKDGAKPIEPATVKPLSTGPSPSCPPGDIAIPLHEVNFHNNPDLKHDWNSSITQWDNGSMDGWTAYGMENGWWKGYVHEDPAQVKPYWTMAQQYVLADEMFPTEFGGSFTGHLTLIAGTDDIKLPGRAEVNFPDAAPDDCDSPPGTQSSYVEEKPYRAVHLFQAGFPCFDQFNTMAEVLDKAGISWKFYATKVLDAGVWEPFEGIKYVRYGPDWKHDIIAPQTRVLKDAMNGNLALVSWVTPNKGDSDHPSALSDRGPSWVTSVVNAIGESTYWPNSAIIVVWDDWGGTYDNAPPPQLDYRGLGIRVPCLIISPYAKEHYVAHTQYEWGSILRFIEEVNGIPAGSIGSTSQGYTDGRANSLDDAFDFSQKPRKFVKIHSKYPASYFLHEPPSNEPVDTE
jgi:phospholipase C